MPELSISRKNISTLFGDMQNKKFIVPDYQRPYKWDEEKCEILWDDIINFFESLNNNNDDENEYFLGTIVTCKSSDSDDCKEFEIIDGQQRITSFLLLLRAFYAKLEKMPITGDNGASVIGLKSQIAPCIWDVDPVTRLVTDKTKIHVESRVATDDDKENFHAILRDGQVNGNTDLYSSNYRYFLTKCEEYAMNFPIQWYSLCVAILNNCIILPIESKNSDTALIIFSTLNDRGLPLSDSDIFKAQIYKSKNDEQRREFITEWKDLTSIVKKAKTELDDIFRYYSHVIRAKANIKEKEIALRKFYSQKSYEKLKTDDIINNITNIAKFWVYVVADKNYDLNLSFSSETRKYLQVLSHYPNEFWKYLTTVFYLKNKDNDDFDSIFLPYLKNLTAYLLVKFIERPTVNAIKDEIYNKCIEIQTNGTGNFSYTFNEENIKTIIKSNPTSRVSRTLILLHAYLHPEQDTLIPVNFDIEHILPQKWQNTNYLGWEESDAKEFIEKFGNKVTIEKRLNIQAGNGYFGKKKLKYVESNVMNVKDLLEHKSNDWAKDDITIREEIFVNDILNFFKDNLS